jgi:NAD(P)H-quinone oxidoreductase subunit K
MSKLTRSHPIQNPTQAPSITHELSENVILTCVDDLYDWARLSTL